MAFWLELFRRYLTTLQTVVLVVLLVAYPHLLTDLNPAPELSGTATVRGVVVSAQSTHPNIRLRLEDGELVDLDFPAAFQGIYFARRQPFSHPSAEELHRLAGCATELRVDQPRFTLAPVNARIWGLRCERLAIPYEEIRRYYREASAFTAGQAFIWFTAALIIVAALIRDGRKS